MTEPKDQKESVASLIEQLSTMNEALDSALDSKEFDTIQELVEQRGPVINALMSAHKVSPVNPTDVERILSFEDKLKTKMRAIQHMLGGELSNSQKHAHAHRMYSRFDPEESL
jgi:hypothetical protein